LVEGEIMLGKKKVEKPTKSKLFDEVAYDKAMQFGDCHKVAMEKGHGT